MKKMQKLFGENYYIDVNKLEDITTTITTESGVTSQQLNVVKFDVIKIMLEVLLTEKQELDDNLGMIKDDDLSIPFKIAFNTLIVNNILKHF